MTTKQRAAESGAVSLVLGVLQRHSKHAFAARSACAALRQYQQGSSEALFLFKGKLGEARKCYFWAVLGSPGLYWAPWSYERLYPFPGP